MNDDELLRLNLVHPIHTTERRAFRSCRRRWSWAFRDMYYPLITARPLEFGVAYHAAMEKWYDPVLWGHEDHADVGKQLAILEFQKIVSAQLKDYKRLNGELSDETKADYRDRVDLGIKMITYYIDKISPLVDVGFKPIGVEVPFEVPLGFRCTCDYCWKKYSRYFGVAQSTWDQWTGLPVTYGGRIDMLAVDEHERIFVFDWKTTSRILDETSEASFLELDDQISCVPLDTEILTRDGWKLYSELAIGQEVLGYNVKTDQLEWTILEAIHLYDDATLVKYSNKSFEFTTTSNHKWVVGHNLPSARWKRKMQPIEPGKQHRYVKLASSLDQGDTKISVEETALIGWVLSDGYISDSNGLRASISQKKYVSEVEELLSHFEGIITNKTEINGCYIWALKASRIREIFDRAGIDIVKNGQIHRNLRGVEAFLLNLPLKHREAFCTAIYLAEGNPGSTRTFTQNVGQKQELFRLAFFLNGSFPTKGWRDKTQFEISEKPNKWMSTIKAEELDERRSVWCPQTGLGTWVMLQRGQMAITGNSYVTALWRLGRPVAGFVYHEQRKAVPEPPKALMRRMGGRGFSTAKNANTDYQTFMKTVFDQDHEAFALGYYDEYLKWLKEEGPRYWQRHQVTRNQTELQNTWENMINEAHDIIDNPRIYPQPGRFSCPSCAYRQPCLGMSQGEDFKYLLEETFEKRTKHYFETQMSTE